MEEHYHETTMGALQAAVLKETKQEDLIKENFLISIDCVPIVPFNKSIFISKSRFIKN